MSKKFTVVQTETVVQVDSSDPIYGAIDDTFTEKCFIVDKTFNTLNQAQKYRNVKKRQNYIIIETY